MRRQPPASRPLSPVCGVVDVIRDQSWSEPQVPPHRPSARRWEGASYCPRKTQCGLGWQVKKKGLTPLPCYISTQGVCFFPGWSPSLSSGSARPSIARTELRLLHWPLYSLTRKARMRPSPHSPLGHGVSMKWQQPLRSFQEKNPEEEVSGASAPA